MEAHLNRLTALICLWTPDGVLSACNDAYCHFFGTTREKLLGKRWLELVPSRHRDASASFIEEFLADPRPNRRENPVTDASGEIRWLDWINQPVLDGEGRLVEVLSEGRDITERRRAEEAARESEQRYRQLFDQATEGMAVADTATAIVEDCNRAFLGLTGFDRADLVGRPLPLVGVDSAGAGSSAASTLTAAIEKSGGVRAQVAHRCGTSRDVEIKAGLVQYGNRTLAHVVFRDVTEERLAARYQDATLVLLRLLNEQDQTREFLKQLTELLRDWTGCQAVGVRLREGDDYPYSESRGFPAEFLRTEHSLCAYDAEGRLVLDADGNPVLDCLCGKVVSGRLERSLGTIGRGGSFWTNNMSALDRAAGLTRVRCGVEGYESVALVPLRLGDHVIGLLQLSDPTPGRLDETLIAFLEGAAEQIAIALEQKTKLSSLEGGLRRIAALVAEVGGGTVDSRRTLPPALRASLATLSRRENEVLRLLLRHQRPVAIARQLARSVHTVRNQLKSIFRKLDVHSQEELLGRLGADAERIIASTGAGDTAAAPARHRVALPRN